MNEWTPRATRRTGTHPSVHHFNDIEVLHGRTSPFVTRLFSAGRFLLDCVKAQKTKDAIATMLGF